MLAAVRRAWVLVSCSVLNCFRDASEHRKSLPKIQDTEDHLKRLPDALLELIVMCVHNDYSSTYGEKTRCQRLRLSCTAFRRASDACKTHIHLRPDQLISRAGYVRNLQNLTRARVRVSLNEDPVVNDLTLLTTTAPNLSSLALVTGCKVMMLVRDLDHMLLPLQHSLVHLLVETCDLTRSVGDDGAAQALQACTLDFPLLQTLTIKWAKLNCQYDMSCPSLQTLCLENNSNLQGVYLQACTKLQTLVCEGSKAPGLDISACQALTSAYVSDNPELTRLVVCDLKPLKKLNCQNNCAMAALDLHGCESLEDIYCAKNSCMSVLQLEGCRKLKVLYARLGGLTALDVSSCVALVNLDCSYNPLLAAFDIKKCLLLRSLQKHGCDLLHGMDTSSHPRLNTPWQGLLN